MRRRGSLSDRGGPSPSGARSGAAVISTGTVDALARILRSGEQHGRKVNVRYRASWNHKDQFGVIVCNCRAAKHRSSKLQTQLRSGSYSSCCSRIQTLFLLMMSGFPQAWSIPDDAESSMALLPAAACSPGLHERGIASGRCASNAQARRLRTLPVGTCTNVYPRIRAGLCVAAGVEAFEQVTKGNRCDACADLAVEGYRPGDCVSSGPESPLFLDPERRSALSIGRHGWRRSLSRLWNRNWRSAIPITISGTGPMSAISLPI